MVLQNRKPRFTGGTCPAARVSDFQANERL